MKPRHIVFSVVLTVCIVFELLECKTVSQAMMAASIDGLYLGILFYGLLWVCKQIFCNNCNGKEQKVVVASDGKQLAQRAPSRITYIG